MIYFAMIFESLEAEGMARSFFWLPDEAWKTLEPHLPHGKPEKRAWTIGLSFPASCMC